MKIRTNIGKIYSILSFIPIIKNRWQLIFSILIGKKKIVLQLTNNVDFIFNREHFKTMRWLLGVCSLAYSYSKNAKNEVEISLDSQNKFKIKRSNFKPEDTKFLLLLQNGMRFGANFIFNDRPKNILEHNSKTIKILGDREKIVVSPEGIQFHLNFIDPAIIVETYILKIHDIDFFDDWNEKIVCDVGANVGDTALYFAKKGARVFAFEPIPGHFNALLKNLELNPELSSKITPINAAIGKDGILNFYHDSTSDIGTNASFVYNSQGDNAMMSEIKGYSLASAMQELNLEKIDLLKTDCKGCEFFLTDENLQFVENIKIEYAALNDQHKMSDLLSILKSSGFQCVIYSHNPFYISSLKKYGTIIGKKIRT